MAKCLNGLHHSKFHSERYQALLTRKCFNLAASTLKISTTGKDHENAELQVLNSTVYKNMLNEAGVIASNRHTYAVGIGLAYMTYADIVQACTLNKTVVGYVPAEDTSSIYYYLSNQILIYEDETQHGRIQNDLFKCIQMGKFVITVDGINIEIKVIDNLLDHYLVCLS